MNRKHPEPEPDDRVALIQRHAKAYFEAVERTGDPADLRSMADALEAIDRQFKLTAVRIHKQGWYSLADIATAVRKTKQAVASWKTNFAREGVS